ncbi:hypothetical protein [uncultured Dysosmobacter sp.]|uniref:hypothetical protein n=1 Tax=uncultured Dysosmobacter sp. TaxID=2591384 RepID=UPI002627F809|nr:hypothetical protein [uncultured Dysosmobacter sp.]
MAGYYNPNKDYSKELQRTDLSSSERRQLEQERQNKINDKYGGKEPTMTGSDKTFSSVYSGSSGSSKPAKSSGGSYDRDVDDAVKSTWSSVYSGASKPAGTGVDYHQQAIDAAARGDWGSVAAALNQRQQKINAQGGNDRGTSNSQIFQQLRAQYGSSFDALSDRDKDTVRLYAGERLQYPDGTDAVHLGKGWEDGVDYLAQAQQLAAQGDLMAAYDALQRRGYKMFDTGSAGGGTTQAQAYADIQKAWMNSSGARQTWQNERTENQRRLAALGLTSASVNPSNAGKTLLKRTADGKTTYWVSYDENGVPVIASPASQDVTKAGRSPGYSPEEIAAMARYYGADAYDPNMYMALHNMAVDRTGVGRKYDATGTLLLDEADFAPAGLGVDASGLAGSMNAALGGSANPMNPYLYLDQQITATGGQGAGGQFPQSGAGLGTDIMSFEDFLERTGYDQYSEQTRAAIAAAVQNAVRGYRDQIDTTNDDTEELARQAYIAKMLGQKNLDQQLSASGYAGGMADSQRIATETNYENQLTEIEKQRLATVRELESAITNAQLTGDMQTAQELAGYLQTIQGQWMGYVQNQQQMANDNYWRQVSLDNENYWNQQSLNAQNAESAYSKALTMLKAGFMPNDETLAAAGINRSEAQTFLLQQQTQGVPAAKSAGTSAGTPRKTSSGQSGTSGGAPSGGASTIELAAATTPGVPTFSQLKQTVSGLVQTNKISNVLPYLDQYWGAMSSGQKQEIQAVLAKAGVQYTPS